MDVKSAFLTHDMEEKVFMTQPQDFQVAGKKHQVYKLMKALYGLKPAPKAWYIRLTII